MRINTLTADPVLRYLLADAGLEPPSVPVREGWEIFKKFLALPTESKRDAAGFQTSWIRENPAAPVFSVIFCRQLSEDEGGIINRAVALNFLFDDARSDLAEHEIWSTDFRRLDDFLDHVERLREFDFALEAPPTLGDVVTQEE